MAFGSRSSAATVVQAGTRVAGSIEGAEDVEVHGAVQGTVSLEGNLLVSEGARVDATVSVVGLDVHGILVGNVTAQGPVVLRKTARVVGDVTAPSVVVEDGAMYRGHLEMGSDAPAARAPSRPTPAPARPAPAPTRPAPAPTRPAPAPVKAAPEPTPEPEEADDEPEILEGADAKKVAVKKKKK